MQERRNFMILTGAAISGTGLFITVQHSGKDAQILLELRNNADIRTKLVATVKQSSEGATTIRRRELGSGEREHFDIKIDDGETYELTGKATVSSDNVAVEGFGNSPNVSEASFQARSDVGETLEDDDRVIVSLTPEKTVQVTIASKTE